MCISMWLCAVESVSVNTDLSTGVSSTMWLELLLCFCIFEFDLTTVVIAP